MDNATGKDHSGARLLGFPLVLLALVALVFGCTILARFRPNTLVKTYSLIGEKSTPRVDDYDINFLIRAREVGNMEGIDTFRFVLELKSRTKVADGVSLKLVRIKSMTILLPATNDSLVLTGDRVAGHSLDVAPQRYRNRIYEYLEVEDVYLPDIHKRIFVVTEFNLHDPVNHMIVGTEVVKHQFIRSQLRIRLRSPNLR